MSKEKATLSNKKAWQQEVIHQLERALGKLKEQLGEKKFESRLKKAAKLLTEDIDLPKKGNAEKVKKAKVQTSGLTSTPKELKKEFKKGLKKTDKDLKSVIDKKTTAVKAKKATAPTKAKA